MTPNEAHRLNLLQFWTRYGLAATCEAFAVSRWTLSREKRGLTQDDGDPRGLIARSSASHRRLQSP